jgi:hypothetical protein
MRASWRRWCRNRKVKGRGEVKVRRRQFHATLNFRPD